MSLDRPCGVAACQNTAADTRIVTDRDGGGSDVPMCRPCLNAFEIGRRDA